MNDVENKTTLREAGNKVTICGWVKKIDAKTGKNDQGIDTISVNITVATSPTSEYVVSGFAAALTRANKENSAFVALKTVANEYISIASLLEKGISVQDAWNQCTKVNIERAKLSRSEYYQAGSDQLRSYVQFSSNYMNRVDETKGTFEPKAEFDVEMFVDSIAHEIKDDTETGRLMIHAYIPMYGGVVLPFDFIVDAVTAESFEEYCSPKRCAEFWGNLVNTVSEVTIHKEGFGAARDDVQRTSVRELIITGGSAMYEEDDPKNWSAAQIAAALNIRNSEYLPHLKNRRTPASSASSSSAGFNSSSMQANKYSDFHM